MSDTAPCLKVCKECQWEWVGISGCRDDDGWAATSYVERFMIYALQQSLLNSISAEGRESSVGIADSLRTTRSGHRNPIGATFSASVQTGLGPHPASHKTGTGSFQGVNRPGCGADHPPLSSPEVKEKSKSIPLVPSGPSWPVLF